MKQVGSMIIYFGAVALIGFGSGCQHYLWPDPQRQQAEEAEAQLAVAQDSPDRPVGREDEVPEPEVPAEGIQTRLRQGQASQAADGLPIFTPFWVDKAIDGRVISSRLAFRGWDFDHNGSFDMVEVMDKAGHVVRVLYDFDFNGIVDLNATSASKCLDRNDCPLVSPP